MAHTAAHYNTLQHSARHSNCNTLQHKVDARYLLSYDSSLGYVAVCCSVLQNVAVCCNVLQCVPPRVAGRQDLMQMCDMKHLYMCHASFLCVTCFPPIYDIRRSCV